MKAEVLVVGGGLAGCAAAIGLARGGRDVVLVEREAAAVHKVCGEFLSREALGYLGGLGVDVGALGAVPISAVRMGGVRVELPFEAMSLTRRRLDEELLRVAGQAGVRVLRGRSVEGLGRFGEAAGLSATAAKCAAFGRDDKFSSEETSLEPTLKGWRGRLDVGEGIDAGAVFLATGKHDLRGWGRPEGRQNDLVAFKMYWRLAQAQAAALDGHVELILYRGGYAGLQMVEGGVANLCCLVERRELQRIGGRWEKFLAAMMAQSAHLRERLQGAEAVLEKALAVAAIPYGMVREDVAGTWCLGDQAAVIPSFTGDGMSIALHTGVMAAEMYLGGKTAEEFQRRVRRELGRQVGLATWVSRGLVGWPRVVRGVVRIWPGMVRVVAERTRISPG